MSKFFGFVVKSPLVAAAVGVVALGSVVFGVVALVGSDDSGPSSTDAPFDSVVDTSVPDDLVGPTDGVLVPVAGEAVVDVVAPAGIKLTGSTSVVDDANWVTTITGGSGSVGGFELLSADFSGSLRTVDGVMSGSVTVVLAKHPKIVPTWKNDASLVLTYSVAKKALFGEVKYSLSRGLGKIDLLGALNDDGSYKLSAKGSVPFAGKTVELAGSYLAPKNGAVDVKATWRITGSGAAGVIDKTTATGVTTIDMTDRVPGVTGTTTVVLGDTTPVVANARVLILDEKAWRVRILNASTKTWAPKVFPVLTVATKDLTGVIASKNNVVTWDLATTAVLTSSKLTMNGTFTYSAAKTWNVAIDSGGGQVLGLSEPISKPSVQGSITIDNGAIDGKVSVTSNEVRMLPLPEGWDSLTRLTIKFSNATGLIVKDTNVAMVLSRKNSRILLDGDIQGDSAFSLTVAGVLRMGATPIPLAGRYESAGYVSNGVARTVPYYKFSGSIKDVAGGRIPLSAGFGLSGGSLGMDSEATLQTAGVRTVQQTSGSRQPMDATITSSISGPTQVEFDATGTYLKDATLTYIDEDNWTATLSLAAGPDWSIPEFGGLTIAASSITGTISSKSSSSSQEATITWKVKISKLTWFNSTTGASLTTDFSLGNVCELEEYCPDAEGLYLGWENGELALPNGLPTIEVTGALNTDGSWGRMSGLAPDSTFGDFTITAPTITIWKGERDDSFDANMEMPDLSSFNDGLNFEFCGGVKISIPGIPTTGTSGCAEWTQDGVVLAQVAVGGDVDGGDSEGIELTSSQLTGWAYTNLATIPTITLYGNELALEEGVNNLTAQFVVPGYLMDKVGVDDSLSAIQATGWFDDSNFSLDGSLEVEMSNSGFTLDSINFHIGKQSNTFSLSIGANAFATVGGNKFPLGVEIGLVVGGGANEVYIEMDVRGTESKFQAGQFDDASLVPTGSFEPDNTTTIDGSFDDRQGKSLIPHGDFEDATTSANLMSDPDLEASVGGSILPNGDFEDGISGDILTNGDLESFDITNNGDFETGDTTGWSTSTNFTTTVLSGATAPTEDEGSTTVKVTNKYTSGGPYNALGLYQDIAWAPKAGAEYTLSAWVKSPDTTTGRVGLWILHKGTASGCSTLATIAQYQIFNVTTDWQQFTFTTTGMACRTSFQIILGAMDAGDSIEIDAVTFSPAMPASGVSDNLLPFGDMENLNVLLNSDFESGDTTSWSTSSGFTKTMLFNQGSTVEPLGSTGVQLKNTGTSTSTYNNVGLYQNVSWAPISGASYTLSAWVKSPDSTTGRVGLWIDQKGTAASPCTSQTTLSQYQVFNVTTSWTQVSYTVTGSSCKTSFTVTIDPLDAGDSIVIDSVSFTPATTSSVTSISSIPNIPVPTVLSGVASGSPTVKIQSSIAHAGQGVLSASGSSSNWDMYWSSHEPGTQFTTYTFSGWVKCSTCSSMLGNVYMETSGGTTDSVTQGITINQTWQQFSTSLYMANSGHTDVRPGFKDIAIAGSEILFDDMSLTVSSLAGLPNIDKPTVLSNATVSVGIETGTTHGGSGVIHAVGTATNWDMYWSTLESPVQYSTYTFEGWAKCRTCTTMTGNVYLDATGGTTDSAVAPITLTQAWQKFRVTLYVSHSNQTDIRPGFKDMATANSEVLLDDMSLQQVGWTPNPKNSNALVEFVSSDGTNAYPDGGLGALEYEARADGTSILYDLAAPIQGAAYTASMWVKAPVNTEALLKIVAKDGTEESISQIFTATSTWTEVSASLAIANSGHTSLRVLVQITSTATTSNPQTIYIDNASVTGEGIEITPVDTSKWYGVGFADFETAAPIYYSSSVVYDSTIGNPGKSLRSDGDNEYWWFNTDTWGNVTGDFDASVDVYFPDTDSRETINLGFWMTGSGNTADGFAYQIDTDDHGDGFVAVDGDSWTNIGGWDDNELPGKVWMKVRLTAVGDEVTVLITRLDTNVVLKNSTMTMSSGNRSGFFGQAVDDYGTNSSTKGVRFDNFQVYSGSDIVYLYQDSLQAHAGSGYMKLKATSGTASAFQNTVDAPVQGSTYVATAWVKSSGTNVSGKMTVSVNGTTDTANSSFTATNTWQQITVTLPVRGSGGTSLRMQFDNTTAGQGLMVDDVAIQLVGLTQPTPWGISAGSNGTVDTAAYNDSTKAHGGNNYFQFAASGSAGSIYYPSTFTPVVGDNYTASVWVKSDTGSNMSGQLGISLEGGTTEQRWVTFTANSTWQQVWISIPVTKTNNTTVNTYVKSLTLGAYLLVDDADMRQMTSWMISEPSGITASQLLINDRDLAANGSTFNRVSSSGPNGGISTNLSTSVQPGATWTMQASVRSTSTAKVKGALTITANGGSNAVETKSENFSVTEDWQVVELKFISQYSHTNLMPSVNLTGSGLTTLDIDAITLTQDTVIQSDPWTKLNPSDGTVTQVIKVDSTRAHESSGVLQISKTGKNDGGVQHAISEVPVVGTNYSGTAWVRSSTGTAISGRFVVKALGGTIESRSVNFTATSEWQMVAVQLPIANSGHTSMSTEVWLTTAGQTLDVDDVNVQQFDWTVIGSSTNQVQMNDVIKSQSGSGYLKISKTTNDNGGVKYDIPGAVSINTSQTMYMYVRSSSGAPVAGRISLSGSGGSTQNSTTTSFTAGSDWTKISVTVPITNSTQTGLQSKIFVDTVNAGLDIDSINVAQEPIGEPDGVTAPLSHPQTGYSYLWDDAFGIPGAHLWALTAQVQIVNGSPGLGLGGTMYFDPTKATGVMTGTDWIKGDLVLNISYSQPCFQFGFDATNTNATVAIDGGVFTTKQFQLAFAPAGCTVGDYVIAPGASFLFDAMLGDTSLHFDLEIGMDDDGLPTFYTDMSVQNLKLAGTTYNDMELIVDISSTSSDVSFNGDFSLPMGSMVGDFALTMNNTLLRMAGSVSLADWAMVGGTMDVSAFNFAMSIDIPIGSGACANFSANTSGDMSMGKKQYGFVGNMTLNCGQLSVFHIEFEYKHNRIGYQFDLDYDSSTNKLKGGLRFVVKKKTSWNYFFHNYSRTSKFVIKLRFSMDFDHPKNATLRLYGDVSVSGGEGSVDCTISASGDDSCSLYVKINVMGTHTYRGTW